MLVLGDKEVESQTLSVRGRGKKDLGTQPLEDYIQNLKAEIGEKSL